MKRNGREEKTMKQKKTKEDIITNQAKIKAITEDICYIFVMIGFLLFAVCGVIALYKMITFSPDWS